MSQNDQPYYEWLISQITVPKTRNKTFYELLQRLHDTEFFWTVPGDDNRVQDAMDLRTEFNYLNEPNTTDFNSYVSILELIIAVSRLLEFVAGGIASEWAWRLIENLGLNRHHDPLSPYKVSKLDEILETFVWRTYQHNGEGGFFPLLFTREDQTKVEIWYQLNAYVNEIVVES